MCKLDTEQRARLDSTHRQLFLFWSDTAEKHVCAKYFISEKQISYLYRLIFKVRDGESLTDDETTVANEIVFKYWKSKNNGGRKNGVK